MARPSKPFLRKQTQTWYCSIKGRQIPLGKDREQAFELFHSLMADQGRLAGRSVTLYELSQAHLDWCEKHRSQATYDQSLRYLKSFIEFVGKRLRPDQLKPHHVTNWLDAWPSLGPTSQNDAIRKVQRLLNWSIEEGYISSSPIARMRKPRRKRREIYYTPEQWTQIRTQAKPPFDDFLDFLYCTGCRPIEARRIEANSVFEQWD